MKESKFSKTGPSIFVMKRNNLLRVVLFFSLVGGLIGSTIIFSTILMQQPFWLSKGLAYIFSVYIAGFVLIGMPVAGAAGLLYGIFMRLQTYSQWSTLKRKLFSGVMSYVALTVAWFLFASERQQEQHGIWVTSPQLVLPIFFGISIFGTIFLYSIAERRYGTPDR